MFAMRCDAMRCDAMRGFVSRVTRNLWMLARRVMALCVMSAVVLP